METEETLERMIRTRVVEASVGDDDDDDDDDEGG